MRDRADPCVVGPGLAGLTTAYLLTKAGRSVIVVDDGPVFSGETEPGLTLPKYTVENQPASRHSTLVNDRLVVHTEQAAYRSYVIGMVVPVGTVPTALYSETCDPYHFVGLTDKGCRQKSRAGNMPGWSNEPVAVGLIGMRSQPGNTP